MKAPLSKNMTKKNKKHSSILKRLKMQRKPGITIGRPIYTHPHFKNVVQLNYLFKRLAAEGYAVDENDLYRPWGGSVVAASRNMIVDNLLAHDGKQQPLHDYILFIDDDQCFPDGYDPFNAFEALLNADKDIIGVPTVRRFPPYKPNISMFKDGRMQGIGQFPRDRLFKVHQIGFGMVLVKRKVIETLYYSTDPPTPLFSNPLEFNPMDNSVSIRGEDYRFCINAMKFGFDIWVDPTIPLLHVAEIAIGIEEFDAYVKAGQVKEELVDICQHTELYAELADILKKSSQGSKTGHVNLSDVANAVNPQDKISRESESPVSVDGTIQE